MEGAACYIAWQSLCCACTCQPRIARSMVHLSCCVKAVFPTSSVVYEDGRGGVRGGRGAGWAMAAEQAE